MYAIIGGLWSGGLKKSGGLMSGGLKSAHPADTSLTSTPEPATRPNP